jgi:methyltransferase (TIGR00027 family)
MRPVGTRRLRRQIAVRIRFFDEQIVDAISAGIDQVVICGAGYDDRALRFRRRGVIFFELDHPATQSDKAGRLEAMEADTAGLTLASADFRADDVAAVLDGCGQRTDRPSLFLCEGLLVYLDQRSCVRLLAGLSSRSTPDSRLAVSLATHPVGLDSTRITSAANAARRAGRTEPWRTILFCEAHLALLEEAGWRTERAIDASELDARVDPDRTQLVLARPQQQT